MYAGAPRIFQRSCPIVYRRIFTMLKITGLKFGTVIDQIRLTRKLTFIPKRGVA